jgi:hypothetical protein
MIYSSVEINGVFPKIVQTPQSRLSVKKAIEAIRMVFRAFRLIAKLLKSQLFDEHEA